MNSFNSGRGERPDDTQATHRKNRAGRNAPVAGVVERRGLACSRWSPPRKHPAPGHAEHRATDPVGPGGTLFLGARARGRIGKVAARIILTTSGRPAKLAKLLVNSVRELL